MSDEFRFTPFLTKDELLLTIDALNSFGRESMAERNLEQSKLCAELAWRLIAIGEAAISKSRPV
jgi:hypothetical protein